MYVYFTNEWFRQGGIARVPINYKGNINLRDCIISNKNSNVTISELFNACPVHYGQNKDYTVKDDKVKICCGICCSCNRKFLLRCELELMRPFECDDTFKKSMFGSTCAAICRKDKDYEKIYQRWEVKYPRKKMIVNNDIAAYARINNDDDDENDNDSDNDNENDIEIELIIGDAKKQYFAVTWQDYQSYKNGFTGGVIERREELQHIINESLSKSKVGLDGKSIEANPEDGMASLVQANSDELQIEKQNGACEQQHNETVVF